MFKRWGLRTVLVFTALPFVFAYGQRSGEADSKDESSSGADALGVGLIAHWTFDDQTASDQSGNGNHGTLSGSPTFVVGISGLALALDGVDDFVAVPNAPTLNPANALTLAAWYRPASFAGTGNDPIIDKGFVSHDPPFYQYHLGVGGDQYSGSSQGHFTFNVTIGGHVFSENTRSGFWEPGKWYHIAGTFDGTNAVFYVNGQVVSTSPVSGAMQDFGTDIHLGKFANLDRYLAGTVDDIRIYERALTQAEISLLVQTPIRILTANATRACSCGQQEYFFTGGLAFASVRNSLNNDVNFGLGGTIGRDIAFLPPVANFQAGELSSADVLLLSCMGAPSAAETGAILDFVCRGGGMFGFNNDSADWFAAAFGGTAGGSDGVCATVSDPTSPITSGPFGAVVGCICPNYHESFISPGTGGQVFLSGVRPSGVSYEYGLGRIVLICDEEWCMSGSGSCSSVPSVNSTKIKLSLASAIRSGRLTAPFSAASLQRFSSRDDSRSVAAELEALRTNGLDLATIATMLELVAKDRRKRTRIEDAIDLVTTGPEATGAANRDTAVVVRELFANAQSEVLVVGYAVYQGQRVFAALAERMRAFPGLQVELFLDIQRPIGDTSASSEIVRRFANRFVASQWPVGFQLPKIYYYPSALELEPARRSSLHAKCVVVDQQAAFVSSANFTEAAQERNVEVGVLIRSKPLAAQITRHFHALVESGSMAPLQEIRMKSI